MIFGITEEIKAQLDNFLTAKKSTNELKMKSGKKLINSRKKD